MTLNNHILDERLKVMYLKAIEDMSNALGYNVENDFNNAVTILKDGNMDRNEYGYIQTKSTVTASLAQPMPSIEEFNNVLNDALELIKYEYGHKIAQLCYDGLSYRIQSEGIFDGSYIGIQAFYSHIKDLQNQWLDKAVSGAANDLLSSLTNRTLDHKVVREQAERLIIAIDKRK